MFTEEPELAWHYRHWLGPYTPSIEVHNHEAMAPVNRLLLGVLELRAVDVRQRTRPNSITNSPKVGEGTRFQLMIVASGNGHARTQGIAVTRVDTGPIPMKA